MARVKLPREKSLILPEVENPFAHHLELTWLDKLQIAVMTVTVVPIKLLLVALCLALAWLLASIALLGRSKEEQSEPMRGWRKNMKSALMLVGRALYFVVGFYRIKVTGTRAESDRAPILICGPHSSFFDSVIFFLTDLPSVLSRVENLQMPVIGTLTRFTQPVFVSREDPNSRQTTIKEIKRRALSGGKWPQIAIFPEGTCTNRRCLISFKPGAFYPGVPVQPVCIRYPNRLDTITWTWEGINAFQCLWYSMCQLSMKVEVEYLPVYTPSQEEINDARLYANNVRAVMAEAMGVPMTDHTYEDIRLMLFAATLNLPAASGLVEFAKLNKKLGINFEDLKGLMSRFGSIAQRCEGHVNLETFARYLNLPVSEPLRHVFDLYDRDGSGTIDFREYVIGLSLVAMPSNNEATIKLAFQLFDHGNKGYIEEAELQDILQTAFGIDDMDVHELFINVDQDKDGHITYEEFKHYAEEKPEYTSIFCKYQELQADNELLQQKLQCEEDTDNQVNISHSENQVNISHSENQVKDNHSSLDKEVKVNHTNSKIKAE